MIAPGQVYASDAGLVLLTVREDQTHLTDGWRCLMLQDYDNKPTTTNAGKLLCFRGFFLLHACERIA